MKRSPRILLTLLTGLFFCCPALTRAGTIRHDKADGLYTSLAASYPSVGRLTWNDGAFSYLASGTLIAPNWVLTAGHVTDGTAVTGMTFLVNGTSYSAAQLVPHPSWNGDLNHGFDIGLIRLTQDVAGVTPAARLTSPIEKGKVGTSVGFGATGTGKTGYGASAGVKRAGNNIVDSFGSALGMPNHFMLSDFDDPNNADHKNILGNATPQNLEYSIAPGDSGGGTFIAINGQPLLAGVHSFISALFRPFGDGTLNASYSDYFGSTRVSLFNDWIDSHISGGSSSAAAVSTFLTSASGNFRPVAAAVPEGSASILAAAGLIGLALMRGRRER